LPINSAFFEPFLLGGAWLNLEVKRTTKQLWRFEILNDLRRKYDDLTNSLLCIALFVRVTQNIENLSKSPATLYRCLTQLFRRSEPMPTTSIAHPLTRTANGTRPSEESWKHQHAKTNERHKPPNTN